MDKAQPRAKTENEAPARYQQILDDWEGRPVIKTYASGSKFCVGDKIYISEGRTLRGPFLVASVPNVGRYTISKEDGTKLDEGKVYEEDKLESAE
ncbi:hypothetical protein EPUS_09308 [Endocarpon pusillum Z07020]|uniref:Uncharacterized protein n=1 Tax=Endocarpon pusillum (strain Z07020 / HMAS-L-300199) TaxID=1263415 RepID=U1HHU3_ENDPU|nr:uncharacterized protein EPUS_09308 [Endocarpon pusillum Z07020]ERF69730.1 hypothetical protein EPUS_09308 [Endocarpon pusillum Z07020]